ncbi:hypothetical protein ANN_13195 [Periplaneta americana]|uniref:Uncharacterized protein n=1 Tax=Periplaneta americana TaxID=6978 RepID=A0ABQ8TIQ8_PERAM|nr:hypothetical protein ANN_13195 [Periplaneta americana]
MSPGSSTESYPAFARIGLRENSGKNLNQKGKGIRLYQDFTPANSWIRHHKGLSSSEWRDALKMTGYRNRLDVCDDFRLMLTSIRTNIELCKNRQSLPSQYVATAFRNSDFARKYE